MLKYLLSIFLFVFLLSFQTVNSQTPAVEIRAVWLTTNWNLDWPSSRLSAEEQKKELRNILDKLQVANFNTVFFQARIRSDVFYKSNIEPLSPFANKDFDALAFAVEECHRRGLECHAWFVTYPVGSKKQVARHGKNSVVNKYKNLCKLHDGEWFLDPGNPATDEYILSLVKEIVAKYDIDGIHFDYIRYPEKAKKFPDNDTYKKYGKGIKLDEWRRNNITRLVNGIYKQVKELKPWVQVSSSPIGKYKSLEANGGGWAAHSSVHQDAALWLKMGVHDALYPMMYYKDRHFYPYLDDWMKNTSGRFIIPGLGVYQMMPETQNWDLKEITKQIDYIREKGVKGQAYFRAGNILKNLKGIASQLNAYYIYPAKLPAMNWLDSIAPNSPVDLHVYKNEKGMLSIRWRPDVNNEEQIYTIYQSKEEGVDINNPQNIIATGVRANGIDLQIETGEFGMFYSVSASDRFHNESVPCFPAFFSHSSYEK